MTVSIIVLALAVTFLAPLAGVTVYRLLRGQLLGAVQQRELALAHAVVKSMREVAMRLAGDVNQHTTRVQEINAGLIAEKSNDVKSLLETVSRLVQHNEGLQQRLADAESRLQKHAEELTHCMAEARTDALTSLPNRYALNAEMACHCGKFQQHGVPLSIIVLDVDNFKGVNDRYGHLCGDVVLQEIARVLQRTQRIGDVVSRFGGEEFVVTLPSTVLDDAIKAAERFRQTVGQSHLRCDGWEVSVTVSAGAAQIRPQESPTALLQRADQALLAAKRAGRNATCWHDGNQIQGPLSPHETDVVSPGDAGNGPQTPPPAPTNEEKMAEAAALNANSAALPGPDGPADGEPLLSECDRNRMFLHVRQRIAEGQRSGEGFAMILLKMHGCDETDVHCLNAVRRLIAANIRDMDIVGRHAPDCYALLLPRTELAEAETIAQRLAEAADECVVTANSGPRRLTVSLAAVATAPGDNAMAIFRRAEMALMTATRNSSGRDNRDVHKVLVGDKVPCITTRAMQLPLDV